MVIACGLTVSVSLVHVSDSQSINGFCLVSSPGKNHFFVFVYTVRDIKTFTFVLTNDS